MANHPNRSPLKIRVVDRQEASPKPGLRGEWTEYQVVKGRNIISRHTLQSEAERALERLLSAATRDV